MTPQQERDRYIEALYGQRWLRAAVYASENGVAMLSWHALNPTYNRWHALYDSRLKIRAKHHDH